MLKFLMCDKYNEFFLDWFLISEVEGHRDGFPDNKVLYSGELMDYKINWKLIR